jgi:hypothetical protein
MHDTERASDEHLKKDRDLFLPLDPDNELRAWRAAESGGLTLWLGDEPLGEPKDRFLGERIVEYRMLVTGTLGDLTVDFTKVMAGFDFETANADHHVFRAEGVDIPVARLEHIIKSKRCAR